MAESSYERILSAPQWRALILIALILISLGLTLFALVVPFTVNESALSLSTGNVSPQDILAPNALTFQSQVLTEQRQETAANAVAPVFSPPDASIARVQVERLRATLSFIGNVRSDLYASAEVKEADLAALQDIQLSQETAANILALSDGRWQAVRQESIVVLEQVMRNTIRETQLEDARRSVPALVSLAIPVDQSLIIAELVSAFVAPNSLYNEELTEIARTQAREAVKPVTRSFAAGETILERGDVVTSSDLEALERFGLLEQTNRWQDYVSSATLTLLTIGFIFLYLRYQPDLLDELPSLTIIIILFIVFLFGARLTIPGHTVLPYLYPLSAFGLVVAALFGTRYGLVFSVPIGILVAYGLPGGLSLTFFYVLSSLFGVLILGRAQRITSFIWAGTVIAVTSAATVIAFRLPEPTIDLLGIATLTGASVLNGIASASLAILMQFFLAQILGLTTALQLLEISRPDNPLLQFILRTAPGTYQHSLQVANLAEQAAERIGADALLTRVGALYHDAGKAMNPYFFIENQPAGFLNPHNDLDPYESSQIIIQHVPDGVELARKYRLPQRILDFIREHHGTLVTRYQYVKAVEAAGGDKAIIQEDRFTYPGPSPRSRETALVMLADACESRTRAEAPKTERDLRELVKSVLDLRLSEGQLNNTEITTRDLSEIQEVFTATLKGFYHPRIEYPKLDHRTVPSSSQIPSVDADASSQPQPSPESTSTVSSGPE